MHKHQMTKQTPPVETGLGRRPDPKSDALRGTGVSDSGLGALLVALFGVCF